MTCHLRVSGPMPAGERLYREMREGTLDGPHIEARIALPGGDWYRPGADGFGRPDVRVQFVTDDDAVILLHCTGLVQMNETFTSPRRGRQCLALEDHYTRMTMRLEAGAAKYAWLNQHVFAAEGRLTCKDRIVYRIYRTT